MTAGLDDGAHPLKSAVLVNGVPASGKSSVARAVAAATGWPVLTLDTVKEALFNHLGPGDREHNRLLGKASYEALFALVADFPPAATVVVDAWFGFQPLEVLQRHVQRAGLGRVVELWCHAPPETVARRYLGRVGSRAAGHLGAEYAPELQLLAAQARPTGLFPVVEIDTTQVLQLPPLMAALHQQLHPPASE